MYVAAPTTLRGRRKGEHANTIPWNYFIWNSPEEKERFWNEVFHLVSCIPQNEMVVFAGDMNGYIGRINVGYDGTHGGLGTALRMLMVPGYWSLQMG